MNGGYGTSVHQIYPRRYFDASPTWFTWNRFTIADVHALRTEHGFQGQNIYFYRNYPIQFIRLVGLVVEVNTVLGGKYTLITLDDGSGACIEVKILRRDIALDNETHYPSNTTVDNIDVHVVFGLPSVYINKTPIGLGSIIRIKGTITSYRNERQLEIKIAGVVKDTNEEAKARLDTAQFKRDLLSKPWILSQETRNHIDERIQQETMKDRERSKMKREWTAKQEHKQRKRDEKSELKRKARETELNAGALEGSNVTSMPWC